MSTAKQDDGVVQIHGKSYRTVGRRIVDFRADFTDYQIETEILSHGELVLVKATIRDSEGKLIATGHAEEDRNIGKINSTSALENAETSAVGRALAFFGAGGTEIASADEVAGAINQQGLKEYMAKVCALQDAVRRNQSALDQFRDRFADGDILAAYEAMSGITEDDRMALQLAPTKGGWFTVDEVKLLKSNDWSDARKQFYGGAA